MIWYLWLLIGVLVIFLALVIFSHRHLKKTKASIGILKFLSDQFIVEPISAFFRWIPGGLGFFARTLLYKILCKKIGSGVTIYEGVKLMYPENIEIGAYTSINAYTIIDGHGRVKLGKWVRMGPRCNLMTVNHKFSNKKQIIKKQGIDLKPIIIEDDVLIGVNVTIMPGVRIGKGAVISAGAVVYKDVKPNKVVGSIQAQYITERQ